MDPRVWHQHYDEGVPTSVEYPMLRLDALLSQTAARYPDQNALLFMGSSMTYGELDALVGRFAAGLQQLGLQPGDRVSVFMPNCPQTVIAYEAIWRAGGVVVPSNPLYTSAEFRHQAADAGSTMAIVLSMMYDRVRAARSETDLEHVVVTNIKEYFPGLLKFLFTALKEKKDGHRVDISADANTHWFQDVLAEAPDAPQPVERDPGDLAALMYTGGTTGVPKGAMLSHFNLVANATQGMHWSTGLTEAGEVMLTALPLTHSYAMSVCMNHSIDRAYTQVLIPNARELTDVLKAIDKHGVTLFPGVPALYAALSNHKDVASGKYDLSSIKQCLSGAAGLPPEIQKRFQELTGGRLVEGYGLSEASPVTHANPLDAPDRTGTIGVPFPDTDCRVMDEETETIAVPPGERGVLAIAGPQVMMGYWNREDETADTLRADDDGRVWLHTGDITIMDEDGYFRIVDRKKDMILAAGGLNVYPREIEDCLYEHPAVAEVGTIGIPPGASDQRAKAFVVLKEGESVTADELIEFCRDRLARFKVPKEIEFRDDLPKTFVGKVLRRELAKQEEARES